MLKVSFIIFIIYFYFIYLLSGLFLFSPILILNKFYKKNFGYFFKNIFAINISFILKNIFQTQVFVNSNKLLNELTDNKEQSILIQNHISEIDFFCTSFILNNIKDFFNFKFIALKKKIIGFQLIGIGLFSYFTRDIYLNRNIKKDYNNLINNNNANLLYIFPEGTCFNKLSKEKSDIYCYSNKLITFNYHLYPRITGIETIIKNHNNYKYIYDLTVVYDTISKKELFEKKNLIKFFYKYDFPSRIFINISKYYINNNLNISNKLEHIFLNKDNFIKTFNINQNKFKKINYNYKNSIISFLLSNFIFIISLYFFYKFNFIKFYYIFEIIFYIFVFHYK